MLDNEPETTDTDVLEKGFNRATQKFVCRILIPAARASALFTGIAPSREHLIVRFDDRLGSYVAMTTEDQAVLAFGKELNELFEAELECKAVWHVTKCVEAGREAVASLRRVEPCHGRAATYQSKKWRCRCEPCKGANTAQQRRWRDKAGVSKGRDEPREITHGSSCWRRGCTAKTCEPLRLAQNKRQAKSRAARRLRNKPEAGEELELTA